MVDHPIQTQQEVVLSEIPSILRAIGQCESGNKQFRADGTIVKNPHSTAQGKYQIMASYHRENALNMGMDIDTEQGNEDFAMYLYKKNGTRDWNASKHCWGTV